MYNFDINMTEQCSLRCTYCIENFKKPTLKNISDLTLKKIIEKFDYLLYNKDFMQNFGGLRICFWGGEPTVNLNGVLKLLNYYKWHPKVSFFMYSNGYHYSDAIFEILKEFSDFTVGDSPKFLTQISYDGIASHDVDRLNLAGKGSALKVKENIFKLNELKIPFIIHPTIAAKNFDKIADNYFEFKRMSKVLNKPLIYSPTIDYMSHYNFTESELESIKETLKNQFIKIAPQMIEFYKTNKIFDFGWMNPNKAICHAGDSYSGIEIDGNLYPCHGIFNEPTIKDSLKVSSIDLPNDVFLNDILKSTFKYRKTLEQIPDECKNCFTHYCLKCNSTKCSISKKENFESKWTDYTNQPSLCELYKFIGIFRLSLLKAINN